MRLSAHLVADRRFCLLVHKNPLNWLSVINDVCVCLCIGLTLSILLTDVFCVWTSKEWWSDARWLLSFGGRSSSAIIDAIYSHNIDNKFGGLNIALHTIIECVEHDNPMEMRSENIKKSAMSVYVWIRKQKESKVNTQSLLTEDISVCCAYAAIAYTLSSIMSKPYLMVMLVELAPWLRETSTRFSQMSLYVYIRNIKPRHIQTICVLDLRCGSDCVSGFYTCCSLILEKRFIARPTRLGLNFTELCVNSS